MQPEELNKLLLENRRYRIALEFIEKWELPKVEHRGEIISFEAANGSNGAREYMRSIARKTLNRGNQYAT